jgi:hypothetical protein
MGETTIVIGLWSLLAFLIGLLVTFLGAAWAFGNALMAQFEKRLDERFVAHNTKLDQLERQSRELERDVMLMRAELPNEYVRREDWIRFSGTIDTKLDWLREKGDETRTIVASIAERVKSR